MNKKQMFGDAEFVSSDATGCPLLRKTFTLEQAADEAKIRIVGLGFFKLYVNGKEVTDELYGTLTTDFEPRNYPKGEVLGHRIYVSEYDVTEHLHTGKNVLAVILANGFYTGEAKDAPCGDLKLCFKLDIKSGKKSFSVISGEDMKTRPSFLKYSTVSMEHLGPNGGVTGTGYFGEEQDFADWSDSYLSANLDDSTWDNVRKVNAPKTEYLFSDCPPDRIVARLKARCILRDGNRAIYDVGRNITGFPVLRSERGADGIKVTFSEDMQNDRMLNPLNNHRQMAIYRTHGKQLILSSHFVWYGFRYFEVYGRCEAIGVCEVHSDVAVNSSFESDTPAYDFLYKAYLNTQLSNMHLGVPSDCPHIEKRGYTGDGQLVSRAAMLTLDARKFFDKWIEDVRDCQDRQTGHVQYTAPYVRSGGGPGGWGCAIVRLGYEYMYRFGDTSKAEECFDGMLKYFDYMEAQSVGGFVVSDTPGEWCLGEWCPPASHPGKTPIPPAFVNNYFYIKSMEWAIDIARRIQREDAIPELEKRIKERRTVTEAAYFNRNNGDFFDNANGANAFALDMGLGDKRTKENLIAHYERLGYFDTGIFGTDIVIRLLFDYGRGDIARRLLTAQEPIGYGKWMKEGATSLWEYWLNPRSKSHPMFGAPASYLFERILGIRHAEGDIGYKNILIKPDLKALGEWARGHITVDGGKVSVSLRRVRGGLRVEIEFPEGHEVTLESPSGERTKIESPFAKTLLYAH